MGEILVKFGASMKGFWWALDDQERRLLLMGTLWLCAVIVHAASEPRRRTRQVDDVADRVIERLSASAR